MNLELDILKKDVSFLKKEVALLKEHIHTQDSRNYFKVQWTFEQQQSFDLIQWLTSFKQHYSCTYMGYVFEQIEDNHYESSLFPDLKNYKIHLCIYFSTSTKQLPNQIESYFTSLNGYAKIYSYIKQEEFDEKCSREPQLKVLS